MTCNDHHEMEPGLKFWSCFGADHVIDDLDDEDDTTSPCERTRNDDCSINSEEDQEMPDLINLEDTLDSKNEPKGPS